MANFATKHSIMTQEMVDRFCNSFYIPGEVHPTALGRGKTMPESSRVWITVVARHGKEVVTEQPKKIKKKRLIKQSDVIPAKKLRTDHHSIASGTLASLEQIMMAGSHLLAQEQSATPSVSSPSQESESFVDLSAQASLQTRTTMGRYVYTSLNTAAATTTSTKAKLATDVNPDLAGPSQLEESEGSDDSFYELATFDHSEVKRWYVPRWNITNDSLLDDGFSCHTLFNVGAAWQICLGSEVRSRGEHELELKEKLNWRRRRLKPRRRRLKPRRLSASEILRLKSQLAEKEAEAAKVVCLRDQVSSLSGEKSALTAEMSVKVTIAQKDMTSPCLTPDFKEKIEVQQEDQAQELYNRVTELEAHVMDVSGHLEGEILSHLLDSFGRKEGILGHALGRAVDFGMQEGLEAGHEHGVAGRSLSMVDAYNPEAARASYVDAVKALEDTSFPLVDLLMSKKDAGMDKVLDCFLLDGPLAGLPEAAYLRPCIEQLSVPIHHAGDKTAVGETSISFALMNVHARAKGAKKHAAALRQLMMEKFRAFVFPGLGVVKPGSSKYFLRPLFCWDVYEEDPRRWLGGSVVAIPSWSVVIFSFIFMP
ncbi:hypothetical protein Tco_0409036 [Tanacetum coccineum]